jgi:hypothetical protein
MLGYISLYQYSWQAKNFALHMTNDTTVLKRKLYAHCEAFVNEKIERMRQAMDEAQQAANEETKSSAGDKFETGRAMMQLEKEKYAGQLAEALELKSALSRIDVEKTYTTVQPGCIVETNRGLYFIAISAGKITVDGKVYFSISLASPIGALLHNLEAGAEVDFRERKIRILPVG